MMIKKIAASIIVMCFAAGITGCTSIYSIQSKKIEVLVETLPTKGIDEDADIDGLYNEISEFAFELLKNSDDGTGNVLISPASVAFALGMTTNGGAGDTLSEMTKVLGGELNLDLINEFYKEYSEILTGNDEKAKLAIANSIWINENRNYKVREEFLAKTLTYYDAEIYSTVFNDVTVKDVNSWVSDKTDKMINKIVERFNGDEVMLLINAIVFDAEWENIYTEDRVWDTEFTSVEGAVRTVKGMNARENVYLSDENTVGFIKNYKGKYQFVALLPDENVDINDYVNNFTAEKYWNMLENKKSTPVDTMIPKFSYEYDISMKESLMKMGMKKPFIMGEADFGNMFETADEVFIGDVIHKTYIEVAEKGTKAAAVTVVMIENGVSIIEDVKEVRLDRPFMYMIVDDTTMLPVFVGVVRDIQ